MGLIVDFVPNHMGIDPRTNRWWRDVLENGASRRTRASSTSTGRRSRRSCATRCCCRFCGDQYGEVLERGELRLDCSDGGLVLRYFERALPINPRHVPLVLGHGIDQCKHHRW